MKELIKTILYEWKNKKLPSTIKREISLQSYTATKPKKIIAINGFRRVGKTYLMYDLIKELLKDKDREEIVYFNFEDERIPIKTEFLSQTIPTAKEAFEKDIKFLFLDELQNIPQWSKWIRRIYDNEDITIFISGSSSKMSSREIPTELRGRFIEINILPLSFAEFLNFKNIKVDIISAQYTGEEKAKISKAIDEYARNGGLPEIVLAEDKKTEIAQSYYQTTVRRDIIERHNIKNEESLKAMLLLLINSKEYSVNKIYNNLKSMNYKIGKTTIQNYIGYIENSYFAFSTPIFSYKIKDRLQYPRKIYFIDNIFLTILSTKQLPNYGRLYENIVAVELLRRHKGRFYYWKNQLKEEVDFAVQNNESIQQLIQVCYDISDLSTKEREIRALLKASKELKCKDLLVITQDYSGEEMAEWFGIKEKIKYMTLWKWLLE